MHLSQLITIVVVLLLGVRWVRRISVHAQGMSAPNRHMFNFFTPVISLIQGAVIGVVVGLFASAVLSNVLAGAVAGLAMGAIGVLVARARK